METLTMTQAAYARHIGRSRQYVSKLVKQGTIQLDADKKIDVAAADLARKSNSDPSQSPELKLSPTGDEKQTEETKASSHYAGARAKREQYQARLAQLEYEQKVGKLLSRSEVEEAMVTGARKIREGHQLIPTWADELFGLARQTEANEKTIRNFLRQKVRDLDQHLADSLVLEADDQGFDDE